MTTTVASLAMASGAALAQDSPDNGNGIGAATGGVALSPAYQVGNAQGDGSGQELDRAIAVARHARTIARMGYSRARLRHLARLYHLAAGPQDANASRRSAPADRSKRYPQTAP